MTKHWTVTTVGVEVRSGCCGSREDTLQIRRIRDLALRSNCCCRVFCCGRGTVRIMSYDQTSPDLDLTIFGARQVYRDLRDVWHGLQVNVVA